MRVLALLIVLVLLVTGCSPGPVTHSFSAVCTRVIDGDTIEVQTDTAHLRIRLYGIDTPEVGQWRADEATAFTTELALRKRVVVTPYEIDRYGRLVAQVSVPVPLGDGHIDLSQALLSAGYAHKFLWRSR